MNGLQPGLDLLRAVAIVSVMLYHLASYGVSLPAFVDFGWMGVDLFFVLSGYLIGWQLLCRPSFRTVALTALTVVAAGMLLRGWLWQHAVAPFLNVRTGERNIILRCVEVIYNPTYTRLDGLLAGVMLAAMKAFRPVWWTKILRWGPAFLAIGVAGIIAVMRIEAVSLVGVVFGFPLLSASLACVVIAAVSPLGRVAVPGARHVAMLSVSLFLTHKQVYHWLQDSVESDLPAFIVYNGAARAIAALLFVAVERPGLWLRDRLAARWNRNAPPRAAALG